MNIHGMQNLRAIHSPKTILQFLGHSLGLVEIRLELVSAPNTKSVSSDSDFTVSQSNSLNFSANALRCHLINSPFSEMCSSPGILDSL